MQEKHLQAYAEDLKQRGCSDRYIKTELSGIRYLHRQVPRLGMNYWMAGAVIRIAGWVVLRMAGLNGPGRNGN